MSAVETATSIPWATLALGLGVTAAAATGVWVFASARLRLSAAIAVIVLGGCATGLQAAISAYKLQLEKRPIYPKGHRQVSAIPTRTPNWQRIGQDVVESADIVKTLGTSNYVTRTYEKQREGQEPLRLSLHVAYYTGLIDTVPHVPERCFVGGGLQQSSSSQVLALPLDTSSWGADPRVPPELGGEDGKVYTVRLAGPEFSPEMPNGRVRLPINVGPDKPFQMNISEFASPDGKQSLFAGYFFIANGGVVAKANDVRTLAFDLQSDHAFYCKVQVNGTQAASHEEFAAQTAALLEELIGEIMRCVPDWIEVEQGRDIVEQEPAGV